ncbi:hypothetical protein L484_002151 [Morus notabilis]|uniref:Uncharacterized protein n=1 Tax=Morus notabilis TaxID=981085 RepID=W9RFK9_9ROSA|nr:hypothetical protein L484_002151 [Morus notabilis]
MPSGLIFPLLSKNIFSKFLENPHTNATPFCIAGTGVDDEYLNFQNTISGNAFPCPFLQELPHRGRLLVRTMTVGRGLATTVMTMGMFLFRGAMFVRERRAAERGTIEKESERQRENGATAETELGR